MKVQIENIGPFEKKIFFEIPGDVVSKEVESTYRALNHNVKLKGFRPGKVPRTILERYYKTRVENEVAAKLIEDSYGKAVEEYHLTPVAAPTILDRAFDPGKDFKYTVTVEVKPEITVEGYLGLEVERPPVVVTEEEVDAGVNALQDSHAQLKPVEDDRPVQEKDFVILDFEGNVEGKPLEGWKVNDHLVQVGSQSLAGNLDERLVGLPRNQERNVTITLPETYSRKELAGKEVNVRLKVKEIKEKVLAVLDDEFAREVGDFQTLQELRARMRQNLEKQKQAQANQAAREKLLDILREKNPFAIPQSMIERQFQHIVARTEIQLARQGIKLDSGSLDSGKIRDSLTPTAEKEVRGSLILEKVAEKENISVTEDDLERRLEQLAAHLNQRIEAVKQYYQQKGRMEDLRAILLEEKTLDFLLDKAKIIEERPAAPDPGPGNRPEEK